MTEKFTFDHNAVATPADTWLPLVAGFFFSSRIVITVLSVRLFGTDPQTGTGIELALNVLLLVLVALSCIGAADLNVRSMLLIPPMRWVLLFLVFSCASLSWSVAASLAAAIAYWVAMASDVAIIVLLVRAGPASDAIHALMKGFVWGACVVAIIAWLLPAQSDLRLGDEELLGPNTIGFLCALALFFAQYLLRRRLGKFGPAAILLGVTLVRTISKTTILAFIIAEGLFLLRDKSLSRRSKVLVVGSAVIVGLLFSTLLVSYFDIYSNTGNSPETLTGRITIWSVILGEAIRQPWLGHGFYSVWKVIPPFGDFEARHAHNELLQQFYLYGFGGIVLTCGIYGSFYREVRRRAPAPLKTFFLALLVFILIRGLAEADAIELSLPLWAITMFTLLLHYPGAAGDAVTQPELDQAPRLEAIASEIL